MDITLNNKKLFTNKFLNGETVNYAGFYGIVTILFLALKQLMKTQIGISAPVSMGIAFVISAAVLFLFEKRFVFNHKSNSKTVKQVILYVFRCIIDFGFYQICKFIFGDILSLGAAFVCLVSWLIFLFFNYYFDRLLVFDCLSNPLNNRNGKIYKMFFYNRFVFLSSVIAIVCIAFIFAVFKLFPFGDTTVMRMDLYHQYGPLFVEFFDRIAEHKSFIYSWESGGGSSFLGNYFNYLSSPVSFLIFLFDRKDISYAITTLVIAKAALSAGTFTYFIKKSLGRHSYVSAVFGVFYAFCGYFLAYYWNIMWLDGMILLPLITLGIENIINKGKPILYVSALTLLFFSSYYMAYMVCIFSILYFILYFFINNGFDAKADPNLVITKRYSIKKVTNNKFINRGLNFALSSVLAAALCACTLIPVYFILQACSATSDSFPSTFESYFDLLNLISSHLDGLETTIRSSGDDVLPNISCGMLAVILVPLYIANKDIRLKEKALYVLLLLFFAFSFDNNCMNFIWHAFHFPNDLPYRFSFMYCFIILIIAFKELMHFKATSYKDIAMVGMLWLLIIVLYEKFPTNKIDSFTIYVSIAFVIIWTGVLLFIKKGHAGKFILGITIVAITFCEVIVAQPSSYVFTQEQKDYVADYDSYTDAINYTYENDNDFYRTELCYLNTRMDPCLYGYNGMSTFSSMAYEEYSQNQYSLGMFGNRINSYTYNTQTPVYNMMFAVKYLMQNDASLEPSIDFYTQVYKTEDEKTAVFKNDYYLPIAFTASSDISEWDNEEGNPFEVQEDFIDRAAGVSNVFIPAEFVSTDGDGVDCEEVTDNGMYSFSKFDENSDFGTVDITIKTVNDSNLYVYITSPEIENVNYYWNNEEEDKYQGISEPYIMDLGKHNKGDEIKISLDCGSIDTDSSYFEIYAYNIDKNIFESAFDMLSLGALNITSYSDTKIEGTINAGYEGILYTSIPYDEGWNVYIDGNKVNAYAIGDSQLAADISEGEHKVLLKYSPKGIKYGLLITIAAWICVIAILIVQKRKSGRNNTLIC
ncbi:MAG: YfhO family protein [Eubacterium sp.]